MVADGVTAAEVLETFRAIADIQARFGPEACQRYVISFTRGPQDVFDVLALADRAGLAQATLDVVPLLESADALRRRRTPARRAPGRPELSPARP